MLPKDETVFIIVSRYLNFGIRASTIGKRLHGEYLFKSAENAQAYPHLLSLVYLWPTTPAPVIVLGRPRTSGSQAAQTFRPVGPCLQRLWVRHSAVA